MDREIKESIAELIDGTLYNHNVYLARSNDHQEFMESNLDSIPFLYGNPENLLKIISSDKKELKYLDARVWFKLAPYKGIITIGIETSSAVEELMRLISKNYNHTFRQLLNEASRNTETSKDILKQQFSQFYRSIQNLDLILLRKKELIQPKLKKMIDLFGFCLE